MATGTIKRVVRERYGFIAAEDGREIFFHQNDLVGVGILQLHEGQQVEFELAERPRGPRATRVRIGDQESGTSEPDPLSDERKDEGGSE